MVDPAHAPPLAELAKRSGYERRAVLDHLRTGRLTLPISAADLCAYELRAWQPWLPELEKFNSQKALITTLEAIDTLAQSRDTQSHPKVVWSGLELQRSQVQRTSQVLQQLLETCQETILLAGYTFYGAKNLLAPLAKRVAAGVHAQVVLDATWLTIPSGMSEKEALHRLRSGFANSSWPAGAPLPELWCAQRTLMRNDKGYAPHSMHAKCVIADRREALVGSANFTNRAQGDNLEVGVLTDDPQFVSTLVHQWATAFEQGVFIRVPD